MVGKEKGSVLSFAIFISLFTFNAMAQLKCRIEYFSTENGLSHDVVTKILKDREGFMWFATWNGINRFDGYSFVSYKSSPGDNFELRSNRIEDIVEGDSNDLWLRGSDKQIYRFDKTTEQFLGVSRIINNDALKHISFQKIYAASDGSVWLTSVNEGVFNILSTGSGSKLKYTRFKKNQKNGYQIPSNSVNFLHEDRDQKVWIGTVDGLGCLVKSATKGYRNINLNKDIVRGASFTTFKEDRDHLYFGTDNGDLIVYNKVSKKFRSLKLTGGLPINALCLSKKTSVVFASTSSGELFKLNLKDNTVAKKIFSTGPIYSIFEDKQGFLWIEPSKQGVIRYNPTNQSYQHFSQATDKNFNSPANYYKVYEDRNGLVWVNMKQGGFGYYNPGSNRVDYFYNEPNTPTRRFSNMVVSQYYDKAGVLWLITEDRGITKVIFQDNHFKQTLVAATAGFKSENEIRGILQDRKNRLWLGAKSGKLYLYQNQKKISALFVNEPEGGLGMVYSMLQDRRGNIWLGTKGNGLFVASPLNKAETKYRLQHFLANQADGLNGSQIYSLLEDLKGRIWIGTFDEGLNVAVTENNTIRLSHAGSVFKNYPKELFNKIRHLALDKSGNVWIGTTNGLLVFDAARAGRYKTYNKEPYDNTSLGDNDVQFIFRDSKDRMWLSTSGGGFNLAVGEQPLYSLKFKSYTTKDGLPNDYILSSTEDSQGYLWIATQNGLSRFNTSTNKFRNFDSYNGLPKVSFSEASCVRSSSSLVFGTSKGYISFNPTQVNGQKDFSNLVFTNLQLNNKDVVPDPSNEIKYNNINYVSKLTLNHNQNIFSIDYATLDYKSNTTQEYTYRLKGFDKGWKNNKGSRRITYTNLPPGDYVLDVKSANNDLYSNIPAKRLSITISPPAWRTWWAYLLYTVIFGALIEVVRRTAVTMLRLRNKITVEQKLAALKINFFTNISHELRTPLTLILNPIEEISKNENLSVKGTSYIDIVRKNANRMVRFVNQLLDLRKLESGKATLQVSRVEIISFVQEICGYFTETARQKQIRLEVESSQKELFAWIDAEKIDIVLYNLLANAFKFTPEGKKIKVTVDYISPELGFFVIQVNDQGHGVEEHKLQDIFELYYEGDKPEGKNFKGTGIGLALSKELIKLHHGKISAFNNTDKGLTISVQLHLDRLHFNLDKVSFIDQPENLHAFESPDEKVATELSTFQEGKDQAPLVLLVEDNTDLRIFLSQQLSEFYRVEVAGDGEEGLEKALKLIPDLILSDVMMPKMDGIQMLGKLKNDLATSHIPIILLTAKSSVESHIEGLKYGADYYLTKPFDNELLLTSIEALIRHRKKVFEALLDNKKRIKLSPEEIVITPRDETFLKQVIQIVENGMIDPDFNIDAVSETINMGRTTFYRKFKSLTGLAPVEFVRDMRLQRGKQLLDAGETNISIVAYSVGFNNAKYFSTCFKEKYHISPSTYLNSKESAL